jgi:hypothetical protein
MGAHDFVVFVEGDDLDAAYRRAVDDATFRCGHDPYNGTISTTNGAIRVASRPTLEAARDLVRRYWDYDTGIIAENPLGHAEVEKWGPALAIYVEDGPPGYLFFGLAAS